MRARATGAPDSFGAVTDKDAAKQRRQTRNRQVRQTRQTRTEAASRRRVEPEPDPRPTRVRPGAKLGRRPTSVGRRTPSRTPPVEPPGKSSAPPSSGDAAPARTGRGRPDRSQPTRATDDTGVGGWRGWLAESSAVPGGRAALLALVVAVVGGITLFLFPVFPSPVFDAHGRGVVAAAPGTEQQRSARLERFDGADATVETAYLADVAGPAVAALFAVVPVLVAGSAVLSLRRPTRSRALLIAAFAMALFVLFGGAVGPFYIVAVGALGFGSYQSRKADSAAADDPDPD